MLAELGLNELGSVSRLSASTNFWTC